MTVEIRLCGLDDLQALRNISIETFRETFKTQNSPENLNAYLEQAFDPERLEEEMSHPGSRFFFIEKEGETAGYLKVNTENAQSEKMGDHSFEVERIYISSRFQKQGLGKILFDHALDLAREEGKAKVWLGVWEKNENAIAFYGKLGFIRTGAHSFFMGDDEQTDYIMERKIDFVHTEAVQGYGL
ncbi:GNAT family acetyltransferase [Bhargavaea cecembensis]|uniref:GNAT family acetyltransferase n=1 Tax=Bhargavaea cecembensis TaxID=394098 RepID=A0A165HKF2_9BACL|nr:GNAT family N-acetyltransferase [Bhargavaea cecembensis]KZE40299.1 GNAT family acetyltransferase [Bhargavaea cecembensis]